MKKLKIGLVLGGGGARGLAHIGILKVLQQNGIQVDVIVGASMGALVGAAYAQNPDADLIENRFKEFVKSEKFKFLGGERFRQQNIYEPEDLLHQISREFKRRITINLAAHRKSLLKAERLETAINELVDDGLIENTKIPFSCTAVDLSKGREVVFTSGDIRRAVLASSAIPGFMPPVEYDDYQLVDGSVIANYPIETAKKLGADIIIASNVSLYFDIGYKPDNVVDLIMRSSTVATRKLNRLALREADLVMSPSIGKIHWSDFEQIDLLIELGMKEARYSLEAIKLIIKRKSGLIYRIKQFIYNFVRKYLICEELPSGMPEKSIAQSGKVE